MCSTASACSCENGSESRSPATPRRCSILLKPSEQQVGSAPAAEASRKSVPARRPRTESRQSATKLFVLDTNVLMHDPTSLFRSEEHDVFLPIMTLQELDIT